MTVVYTCPGNTGYGRGLNRAAAVHGAGCCAQFALMTDERRAEVGLHQPAPEPRPVSEPYRVDLTAIEDLAPLISRLQREATEHPDQEPAGVIAYVKVPAGFPMDQFQALLELGRPYGLVVGYSREAAARPACT